MKTITELSVCALKDALTQGDVSAREAAQAYLSRIEERDKEIGAYLTVTSRQALEKAGIRCATGAGEDLLKTPEVATLRSILQTISNPRQDIPLLSALARPAFGFTADDLARIRSG